MDEPVIVKNFIPLSNMTRLQDTPTTLRYSATTFKLELKVKLFKQHKTDVRNRNKEIQSVGNNNGIMVYLVQ